MPLFVNHYHCPQCKNDWQDAWDATCDDDCPTCGMRHISPFKSGDFGVENNSDTLASTGHTGSCETHL